MNTNQTITNNNNRSLLKGLVTIIMVLQLTGCFVNGGDGGLVEINSSDLDNVSFNNVDSIGIATEENEALVGKALSWTAPVAREDASPISMAEIAGYRVYYGDVQGEYSQKLYIDDAYSDGISLNVPSGTYYVVITAIDVDGRESAYSDEFVLNV